MLRPSSRALLSARRAGLGAAALRPSPPATAMRAAVAAAGPTGAPPGPPPRRRRPTDSETPPAARDGSGPVPDSARPTRTHTQTPHAPPRRDRRPDRRGPLAPSTRDPTRAAAAASVSSPGPLAGTVLALHKPWGVLSQFTPEPGSAHRTLGSLGLPGRVYPIGRLDADSEGLLLLACDAPGLAESLLSPGSKHPREYWAQVEGIVTTAALLSLESGVELDGRRTAPCRAWALSPPPAVSARDPPIRVRKSVPDSWLGLELTEGRNRQARRMTAAVGLPTLRLLRARIGGLTLKSLDLSPGMWRPLSDGERLRALDGAGGGLGGRAAADVDW